MSLQFAARVSTWADSHVWLGFVWGPWPVPVGYAISGDVQLPRIRDPGILVFGGLRGLQGKFQVHVEGLVSSFGTLRAGTLNGSPRLVFEAFRLLLGMSSQKAG